MAQWNAVYNNCLQSGKPLANEDACVQYAQCLTLSYDHHYPSCKQHGGLPGSVPECPLYNQQQFDLYSGVCQDFIFGQDDYLSNGDDDGGGSGNNPPPTEPPPINPNPPCSNDPCAIYRRPDCLDSTLSQQQQRPLTPATSSCVIC